MSHPADASDIVGCEDVDPVSQPCIIRTNDPFDVLSFLQSFANLPSSLSFTPFPPSLGFPALSHGAPAPMLVEQFGALSSYTVTPGDWHPHAPVEEMFSGVSFSAHDGRGHNGVMTVAPFSTRTIERGTSPVTSDSYLTPFRALSDALVTPDPDQPSRRIRQAARLLRLRRSTPDTGAWLGNSPRCCKYMPQNHWSLRGPLPSHDETLAYLQQLFGVPGADPGLSFISKCWDSSRDERPQWRPICIAVIWESPGKALTTKRIYQALINTVPYCQRKADAARPPKGKKATGWAASVVALLSKECIFTQRTPDGRKSKEWRINIRGADYHTTLCAHQRALAGAQDSSTSADNSPASSS